MINFSDKWTIHRVATTVANLSQGYSRPYPHAEIEIRASQTDDTLSYESGPGCLSRKPVHN